MARGFQTAAWSLQLPDGWEAVSREDYVEIRVPFAGTQLRITPYRDETGRSSAADWPRATAHFNRTHGRRVIPRRCGDFAGRETPFDAERVWIRGWASLPTTKGSTLITGVLPPMPGETTPPWTPYSRRCVSVVPRPNVHWSWRAIRGDVDWGAATWRILPQFDSRR